MKISEAFPSKYYSAADLGGKTVKVTIERVEMEKLGEDMKPVVYFPGKKKGVALNKTNARTIAEAYGDDTDDWIGQPIMLFPVMTDFQGKTVEAIRVRRPTAKDMAARPPAAPPSQREPENIDEEVPF